MKKVLFATTALVATAGVASADVALTGSAEMGVVGGSGGAITQFHQDLDVRFTLSGETDGGITFGAIADLDEVFGAGAGIGAGNDHGMSVFVSGDFGTLSMGDVDGGFDAGMQEVNIGSPGSIDDAETAHLGYNGNAGLDGFYDGQVLSYSYSISGFTITGSVEMDDDANHGVTTLPVTATAGARAPGFNIPTNAAQLIGGDGLTGSAVYGIGASYAGTFGGGSYTVGGGYQTVNDFDPVLAGSQTISVVGVSATVALDMGVSAGINYSMFDVSGLTVVAPGTASFSGTHMAIGAAYAFDDFTVHANYGQYNWDTTAFAVDQSGYGLAVGYDMGGGLNALLGYGWGSIDALNASAVGSSAVEGSAAPVAPVLGNASRWSLGLSMSF